MSGGLCRRAAGLLERAMSGGLCRRAAGARPAEPPAAVLLHKTVDFAVVGRMASSRCRRQATAAKTTAQEKESCWLLLLLAPAAAGSCCGGASLRSPMRLTGCRWGLRSARRWPCWGREPPPPEQLNTCGGGGFCRRRWDGFQPLPPTGDSRKKKQHKRISSWPLQLRLLLLWWVASLRSPLAMGGEPPGFGLPGFGLPGFRASGLSGFRAFGLPGCSAASAATVDFAATAAVINPDSRPVPERWILPPPCGGGGFCRRCS